MIKRNKPLINFIKNMDQNIYSIQGQQKEYVMIKVALLKWLIDHYYIQWDLIIRESLNRDFTFQNIVYWWGKKKINLIEENHHPLKPQEWNSLQEILLDVPIFSKESSTILGEVYQYINHLSKRKKEGMFYTPFFVIEFMLKDKMKNWQLEDKIIDPACGCGFFLGVAYDELTNYYMENPRLLGKDKDKIHQHILKHHLYGIEKNPIAVAITKLVLLLKHKNLIPIDMHILCEDSLLGDIESIKDRDFRLVIGNPPYVGHKKLDKQYRELLNEKYGQVFQDKGDLSYCFFQKGIGLLKEGGELCYITSRYFLEALNGGLLREYILNHCKIREIIDFYGQRILKGIQVDPLIITLMPKDIKGPGENIIEIFKMKVAKENLPGATILQDMINNSESRYFNHFKINQRELAKEGWRLLHPRAKSIIAKIEEKSFVKLEDICESKQGIITGRDKAFVSDQRIAKGKSLHRDLLKPWIKGKNITPFHIAKSEKVLLYSNDILDINQWPHENKHLLSHKSYLEKRRECLRGTRKWYELQWGRDKDFFEGEKIIFPYKASSNRFALDSRGYFYSADIYGLRVKKKDVQVISHAALTLLLNTKVYEFYFKGFAKKLGESLYEYYPNTLMQLSMPQWSDEEHNFLKTNYQLLMKYSKEGNEKKVKNIMNRVDQWLFDYFGFNHEERKHITKLYL